MAGARNLKLLVVEDDLEDSQLVCEALLEIEETGPLDNGRCSTVEYADRLEDALRWLRRSSFDAILLNLSLPDTPTLLDSFLAVSACAEGVPIVVLADEADENFANRLLREGAQDVVVKSELECAPLARAIRFSIERQRRASALHASAFVDDLTGVLTRRAFLTGAAHRGRGDLAALVEIAADREALDPLLIQAAELLRSAFGPSSIIGRWDRSRLCVITDLTEATVRAMLRRGADVIGFQFSVSPLDDAENLEENLAGNVRAGVKTAMLAD